MQKAGTRTRVIRCLRRPAEILTEITLGNAFEIN
jgi:hypothetical protein